MPPSRTQKWAARHPVAVGLCMAVPFALFFLLVSEEGADSPLFFSVLLGLGMGVIFACTALGERLRQRRLKRLGIWNGS
ncbi:hypothetical protein [Streptomyces sp. NPDC056796]|uniref:hypothetical protein n=1 Tax=unclassified Streptomyces TaxID=2593676 RepID=UPI0036790872